MAASSSERLNGRSRAAKACKRCNQRKIKCNVTQTGIPCHKCITSNNESSCALLESRRGTYDRKKARIDGDQGKTRRSSATTQVVQPVHGSGNETATTHTSADIPSDGSTNILENEAPTGSYVGDVADMNEQDAAALGSLSTLSPDFASPESTFTNQSTTSSYREVSWSTMFDRFLNNRKPDRRDMIDKCSITYLGESFPLSLVLADLKEAGGKTRLHHPGPPLEEDPTQEEPLTKNDHPPHMESADITYLEAKNAFVHPTDEIQNALISVFLERYWPIYPIVHRQELLQQHKDKSIPWILLHSICFVAATYCPTVILHRAGFASRKQARWTYHRKAKALFDTGYERNKIVILQSVIMLTFWGGGPSSHSNFVSWIGTGVTIAETLGMHRSLDGANIKPQDRSLLKRLYWVLFIRDSTCSSLIGRPFRINLQHCDTEMLTERDFDYDLRSAEFDKHPLRKTFSLYQIHMAKLCLILREVIAERFDPGRKDMTAADHNKKLQDWRSQLPAELAWSEKSANHDVFASCLCIQYNHHVILAHLGNAVDDTNAIFGSPPSPNRQILEAAAHRIAALSCSIVTKSQVLLLSHEAFHGLFLAMVVFYTQMKSPQAMVAQLGRTALNNCQLVLHDARDAWDPSPWVMKLFDNLISNLEEEAPDTQADVQMNTSGFEYDFSGNMLFDGSTPIDLNLEGWQMQPTLGTFFGMSDEGLFPTLEYPSMP